MNNTLRINAHHLKLNHGAAAGVVATSGVASVVLTGRRLLRNIANLFRAVEFLVCLAMISRLSFNLPLTLSLSRDFLHDLATTLVSPRFVFVLGNAIVLTLFLKSGHHSHTHHVSLLQQPPANHAAGSNPSTESMIVAGIFSSSAPISNGAVLTVSKKRTATADPSSSVTEAMVSCCRRSKSEKVYLKRERLGVARERKGEGEMMLPRTKTERLGRRAAGCACEVGRVVQCRGEEKGEVHYPEDHMSSEEFRRTVEDFIARQQRFLREEDQEREEEEQILRARGYE